MQFSEERLHSSLHNILETVWKTNARSIMLLGKGVYGQSYGVTFGKPPYHAVVKIHTYLGMGDQERRQLDKLHKYVPTLVPAIYAYLPETMLGEAIVMEWLPGKSFPQPELFSYELRTLLQQQAVTLLLNLHAVQHPQGFGSFDGPFYKRWWIWKWLSYYLRVRVKCREWVLRCGRELQKAADTYF